MRFLNNFYEIFNFFLETQKSCDFFEKKSVFFGIFFKKIPPPYPLPVRLNCPPP